jgi:2,4-dienoyl-CoA reductase-like NADH-dependent reductase (Old Yellow Enzyme family)
MIREIIAGIRARCRPDFNLGIRLSPERFGLKLSEILSFAQSLMTAGDIDYLDMSLWDVFKLPTEEEFKDRSLMAWFAGLDRGHAGLIEVHRGGVLNQDLTGGGTEGHATE